MTPNDPRAAHEVSGIRSPFAKSAYSVRGSSRIAACLSSLDAQLIAQSQKLAALRTHKKALMQQLFPSAEGE